eukprot:GHVH01007757.1.p1 GENE.GHVH01007757.1~~GHVH01007757.1.p1  ORF type:complete len:766 (+),score=139.44 GHVH01007757.1:114-2411(+)
MTTVEVKQTYNSEDRAWLDARNQRFDHYAAEYAAEVAGKPREQIRIVLPDGSEKEGLSWETTPLMIATSISNSLAKQTCVAKVSYDDPNVGRDRTIAAADGDDDSDSDEAGCCSGGGSDWMLWDAGRPLVGSCKIQLLKFEDEEGRRVFWHSSAHVLGECLEREFGVHLTIGPALDRGFYYDAFMGASTFKEDHYDVIEKAVAVVCKEAQPFARVVVTKAQALDIFKDNKYKVELISKKIADGGHTSIYRCGDLIDLCRGPHLANTSLVKAFAVEKHSSAYWLGNCKNDSLQRVYAISFPDQKQLNAHKKMIEQAKERDHRTVGSKLGLYMFQNDYTPGSAFWFGPGTKIFNALCELIRREYRIRGFEEVITPNLYSAELFKVSGHYQNYKDDMFMLDCEGKEWGLKPMNCPGHCLMFKNGSISYKQLPWRVADFGILHRNEASGALSGLTRVRRFVQDDAHIFCAMDQIRSEVKGALDFLTYVYSLFGFESDVALSTRPKKALGEVALWDEAEAQLKAALDESGMPWKLNAGDGAFYGPKIDIRLKDCLGRFHQCGTVQLDFQLPLRFDLSYRTSAYGTVTEDAAPAPEISSPPNASAVPPVELKKVTGSLETPLKPGTARPVIIHRAVLGSLERFTSVAVEHFGARFPFWMSPRQIKVLPISEKFVSYGRWIYKQFNNFGFNVELDESDNTINKKIRVAQQEQWNYMLIVGENEKTHGTVTVRIREDPKNQVEKPVKDLLDELILVGKPCSKPCEFEEFADQA